MKNNLTCEVVEDLMPSYIDELTSETTNKAVREHLAQCEKCSAKLENMKEPYSQEKIEKEKKEIDFLKKNRKKNIRTILLSFITVILVVAVAFCTLPYMESEKLFEDDLYYDLEFDGRTFRLIMLPVSNEIVISDVVREAYGSGEKGLDIRGKKKIPFGHDKTYIWEYTPEDPDEIKSLKIYEKILWEDGEIISDITSSVFLEKHLYIGDVAANGALAGALGVNKYLGSFTTKLQTIAEPYGWSFILSNELLPSQVSEKEALMRKYAYVLLAMVDNVDSITFEYEIFNSDGEDEECKLTITRQQANEFFGDDIRKCYGDINELQALMEKTELTEMPYVQQNDKDHWYAETNEKAMIKLLNVSEEKIKKIKLYCYESEAMSAVGFGDEPTINIGERPSVTDVEMDIWLESKNLSANVYDESRLGMLTVEVTVYDWDDKEYVLEDQLKVSAQFPAVYYCTLDGDFENGFTVKMK